VSAAVLRSFASLRVPNYRRYFSGQLVSLSGNWMQIAAEMWLILSLTGSAVAVGVTAALQFLPMLLFGAWGGVLADRRPKRSLLLLTQALMAIPALCLWGVTAGGVVEPWMVFGLVFVRGAINAVDNPTRQSFVIEMVGSRRVVNAVALNSVLIHAARIVGPAAAGVLIATVGIATCFLLNALSFLAMIVALRAMDPASLRSPEADRAKGGVGAALRYVRGEPNLLVPLAMMALVGTLAFNFQVVLPLLGRFTFEGGVTAYTTLAVAMGVGSVIGALVTGARERMSGSLVIFAATGFGALALLAAAAPSLPIAAALLVPLGAFTVSFAASINSMLQLGADPSMRGRVMALYSVVFLGSTPIGAPIVGLLAELAGPRSGLVLAGLAALAAAGGAAYAFSRPPAGTTELAGARRWWWRRLRARRPVAVEAGSAHKADRLEGRGGLDVEADPVAFLDRGDGALAPAPGERDRDRVAGADRRDLGPEPAGTAGEEGEGADRPEAKEGDPGRALRRQAGRRSRAGENPAHRIRRARRAPEPEANPDGGPPPGRADQQRGGVPIAVRDRDADHAERGCDARHEQDRHPQ